MRGISGTVPWQNKDNIFVEAMEPGALRTGAALSAAREAAGIDLVDLARESRVPLRHLRAIEADSHDGLPAMPYTIGFVKSFARAVGLDPEVMAAQFRSETTKVAHVPTAPSLEPLDERRVPGRGLVIASVIVIVLIIAALSAWGAGSFDPAPVAVAPAAHEVVAEVVPNVVHGAQAGDVGIPAAADAAVGVVAPADPAASADGAPVVLTAKEDVWVKIYDRSTRTSAKIGILKRGESFAVPLDQPGLLLWTGKAGALTVSVGGKTLPPLGGPVETIRDISLSANDLLARASSPAAVSTPAPTPASPTIAPGV